MNLYRISRGKYIRDLSGKGARSLGGRWNHKGTPVLYTSQSESLAALETLVHVSTSEVPNDLKLLVLTVPDNLRPIVVERKSLPENWRNYPAPYDLAEIGSDWINSESGLLLKVPSVLTQTEWNMLVNPAHPDIDMLEKKEIRPFTFDSRLVQY